MIVLLLAGIGLLSASDGVWNGSDAFVVVGFIAIIALFGLQHGFFQPQVRKAKELAERDLQGRRHAQPRVRSARPADRPGRRRWPAIIVVVTIFFMAYKPFM